MSWFVVLNDEDTFTDASGSRLVHVPDSMLVLDETGGRDLVNAADICVDLGALTRSVYIDWRDATRPTKALKWEPLRVLTHMVDGRVHQVFLVPESVMSEEAMRPVHEAAAVCLQGVGNHIPEVCASLDEVRRQILVGG